MKKNIIIGFLVIITIISMLFGYSQRVRAEKNEVIAIEQTEIAEAATVKALIAEDSANVASERAKVQRIIAEAQTIIARDNAIKAKIAEERLRQLEQKK